MNFLVDAQLPPALAQRFSNAALAPAPEQSSIDPQIEIQRRKHRLACVTEQREILKQARCRRLAWLALAALVLSPPVAARGGDPLPLGSYSAWKNGPSSDPAFFPIAVWLQNPKNAEKYKAAGINLYVGLWRGPTEEQLATLRTAGMRVICSQNAVGLAHRDDSVIAGWMHNDEPDNAQSLGRGKGYGPPVLPEKVVEDYRRFREADPTRPVFLNLGQGVAWDNYIGRGVRRNHPEDYPRYVEGADIVSFDIYPVVHTDPEVAGKLEYVARGVARLKAWAGAKPVWNCIECTRIGNVNTKPTPEQVRSEVWMSLIHGSQGLIYFVHQFEPQFDEAALLHDPEMLAGVTAINRQILDWAPVLNSPTLADQVTVTAPPEEGAVAVMVKRHGERLWLFAVNMRNRPVQATFRIHEAGTERVEVLGESRTLQVREGTFTDAFKPYEPRFYRLPAPKDP